MIVRALPLNLFAVPLGLAGLGGAWSAAASDLGAPAWPDEVLFAASTLIWAGFSIFYLVSGILRRGSFRADLTHPGSGPFAAYIPVIGILLAAHYGPSLPGAAPWLVGIFVAALGVVAAQLIAHWLTGELASDALHPGYFLPVVAGAFIASIGLSSIGAHPAAIAAFGVGVFFWLVVGTIVTGRLMTGAPLVPQVRPTMAVLLAPPATGGVAWFLANGGQPNPLQDALAGVLLIMLLVQLLLIRQYLAVPFGMYYWAFTFPVAATANYAVRWLTVLGFPGSSAVAWIVLGVATATILAIAARSLVLLVSWTRSRAAELPST